MVFLFLLFSFAVLLACFLPGYLIYCLFFKKETDSIEFGTTVGFALSLPVIALIHLSNFIFFTDFYKIFILWTFAAITIFTVVRSHKTLKQNLGLSETFSVAVFLFVYYMFISFVNVVSTVDFIKKGTHGW